MNTVAIGLIGFGTIGSGVIRVLQKRIAVLEKNLGFRFYLKHVCDADLERKRPNVRVDKDRLTADVNVVLNDPDVRIVIELIGGVHPAKEYILEALCRGKHVITANKALLAEEGDEIFRAAEEHNVDVFFEASVGGGIPIIKALREGLVSNQVETIFGIINGTSNYILSQMFQKGCDFKSALREAQEKGFAEKDPALDIDGTDSAHKIAILARMAFAQEIQFGDIYREGIQNITLSDVRFADEFGYCIKLLAIARRAGGELELRVHPTLLPKKNLLSGVNGVFNAISISADLTGETLFYGQGAGQFPTASAVVSDIVDAGKNIVCNAPPRGRGFPPESRARAVRSIEEIESRYYIRFSAIDRPGVLSQIANVLGKHDISIYSVIQKGRREAQAVPIVMLTHEAKERSMRQSLAEIERLAAMQKKPVIIRIERG